MATNSKLTAINKRATAIQQAGGKKTKTITKYKIGRAQAVKKASQELKAK